MSNPMMSALLAHFDLVNIEAREEKRDIPFKVLKIEPDKFTVLMVEDGRKFEITVKEKK
jgi:hypothetical protein